MKCENKSALGKTQKSSNNISFRNRKSLKTLMDAREKGSALECFAFHEGKKDLEQTKVAKWHQNVMKSIHKLKAILGTNSEATRKA